MKDRIDLILEHCRSKKVLDVGVAGDKFARWGDENWLHGEIRRVASEVVGIDTDRKELSRLPSDWKLIAAHAENFHLSKRFDVVVAGELIEHLSNPGLFLRCTKDHLETGGELVLTTPNLLSLYSIKRRLLESKEVSENHVCGFTPPILRQMLERNGWKVSEMRLVRGEGKMTPRRSFTLLLTPEKWLSRIFCAAEVQE